MGRGRRRHGCLTWAGRSGRRPGLRWPPTPGEVFNGAGVPASPSQTRYDRRGARRPRVAVPVVASPARLPCGSHWESELYRISRFSADDFAWDSSRSPYPGLEAFGHEDVGVFFGRDEKIAELMDLVQLAFPGGPGRFVAVVGPSGSGKSSLLRAGVLPRLRRDPERWVVLPPLW